jgi:hypothetical protein
MDICIQCAIKINTKKQNPTALATVTAATLAAAVTGAC